MRANAWISGVLLAALFLLVNAFAREHLAVRRDLSEDQLYTMHPAVRSMLGELDDVLRVDAYFTGEVEHGPVQIAKGRLVDMLRELESLAGDRIDVRYHDPNASSQAQLEADRLGLLPLDLNAMSGTQAVTQRVWLGLVLRYRGRERVLPWVLPQDFEYACASQLRQLLDERRTAVGFLHGTEDAADGSPFRVARELLRRAYRIVEVEGLAEGRPVDADVDVLIVARPRQLHPREVFAIDQFLQRGGRLLVAVDRLHVNFEMGVVEHLAPGLDALFAAWGLGLTGFQLWDLQSENISIPSQPPGGKPSSLQYPYFPRVRQEQLATELPPMAGLQGFELFWAHALVSADELPEGVTHEVLATSSEDSWLVPPVEEFHLDKDVLNALGAELLARGDAAAHPLAVSVAGSLPSPFAAGGAPASRDPIEYAIWRDKARAAREAGAPPPALAVGRTDEPVPPPSALRVEPAQSGAAYAQVVVVGDSDWISDGNYFTEDNRRLLLNLVDWLSLEEDLLALRSRMPRERRIADFLAEEQAARGLTALRGSLGADEQLELAGRIEEARSAARARRRASMAWATGGSLGVIALVVALARFVLRRPVRGPDGGSDASLDSRTGNEAQEAGA